jgi:hypothetical protein
MADNARIAIRRYLKLFEDRLRIQVDRPVYLEGLQSDSSLAYAWGALWYLLPYPDD